MRYLPQRLDKEIPRITAGDRRATNMSNWLFYT